MARPPRGRRWGSHERVIFSVTMVSHPEMRNFHRAFFGLKTLRTNADYDLHYADAAKDVAKALQNAKKIITWIDALP